MPLCVPACSSIPPWIVLRIIGMKQVFVKIQKKKKPIKQKYSLTHNWIKSPIQFWVHWSLVLCILDMKQVDTTNSRRRVLISGPVMLYWCYLLADVSALGSLPFFLGKLPAGPVCGITPQDPSRAGSQKRKQLSDNELLFCDQTSAFLRSEWGSWECVKNHTHGYTHSHVPTYTHIVWIPAEVTHIRKTNYKLNHFSYLDWICENL